MSNNGAAATVTPGWYADPIGRFELRFYNGRQWTADVSTGGSRFIDPLGIEPRTAPIAPSSGNALATSAMTLGIIAVSIAWMPFLVVIGVVAAIIAIALGWAGVRRARESGTGRSRAIVGIATGVSALVASVLGVLLSVIVYDVYDEYVHPAANEVDVTSCDVVSSRAMMTGEITNIDDSTADFVATVAFVRRGTHDVRHTGNAEISDIEPGGTVQFDVQGQVDVDLVDCEILEVTGPAPFGLELD